MATIASPSQTSLYLNAFDKTIQVDGIMKTIDDDYWTASIVPILYPMWDSDNDKLEVFTRYKDGTAKMNKTKYTRNQKTGVYKWVSYQFELAPFMPTEINDLESKLKEKFTEYRVGQENDLERALAAHFSKTAILNWTKVTLIRNFLLMDSDWTQLGDAPCSDEEKARWVAYRKKLRDIPKDHAKMSANSVPFPMTPPKWAALADGEEYLDSTSHFFTIPQSVYSKFSTRIVNYLAMAIGTTNIDGMEVTRISAPSNVQTSLVSELDEILDLIDKGEI